ncbi:MAG: carboxypeptidase regulatory-like domain-containing protein [Bacteroidota bacterium]
MMTFTRFIKLFLASIVLATIFSIEVGFSQTGEIHGYVIQKRTKELVPFSIIVIIRVNDSKVFGTVTDSTGFFEFVKLIPGCYKTYATSIGKGKTDTIKLTIAENKITELNFELIENCPNKTYDTLCTACHKKDMAIGISPSFVDVWFKNKRHEKKYWRDFKKNGYTSIIENKTEKVYQVYSEKEANKLWSPCYEWFCKRCKIVY